MMPCDCFPVEEVRNEREENQVYYGIFLLLHSLVELACCYYVKIRAQILI